MWERIRHMIRKEFIQVLRDPRTRGVIFVLPIVQLLVFSYAVNTDVTHIALAVRDADGTAASRALVTRFTGSGYFDRVFDAADERDIQHAMDHGWVQATLDIPRGFGAELEGGRTAEVQFLLDGSDSNTSGIIQQYAIGILGVYNSEQLKLRIRRLTGEAPAGGVELRARAFFNENLDSRNFFIPGVIALMITLVTLILTSLAVVREKEAGTMEQLMVTPIRPKEIIIGKTVPFAVIGFVDIILVTVVGVAWFGVPIRGNLLLLAGATVIYLLSTLGIGLFISTISGTQQQALMSTFFFFLPAIMLSGFMFPIANMPEAVQWITYANPMRYYLVIVRFIFLKGVGADLLWPYIAVLAGMGFATLGAAVLRFRKTLQ
ncbi:MAG: ABC transporter permease [Acidobacteria bacterium]|nr:ABC transporter permease [Acidobacteriota bacterium]